MSYFLKSVFLNEVLRLEGFEIVPSQTVATITNVLEPPFVSSSPMPLLTYLLHTNYHNKPHSYVVTISKNMSSTL